MAKTKKTNPQLRQDPNNYNAGTAKGNAKIGETMDEVGYLRSGVAAADGTMIAGNKSLQQAEARDAPIRYVHTEGDEYVVVVRDDITGQSWTMPELTGDKQATDGGGE